MKDLFYHFTDLKGVLSILQCNRMEARCSALGDFNRVSFTVRDNLWEHGDWRITFNSEVKDVYSLSKFEYDKAFGQYSYEKEWYSKLDMSNIRDFVIDVDNTYEYLSVDIAGWLREEDLGDLYKLTKLIVTHGLFSDRNHMWLEFMRFCDRNTGHLFPGKYIVFVDYNGEVSIQEK